MKAQIIDLAAERRRRNHPLSIEIEPAQLAALASPSARHHLVTMLDSVEFEFEPRATLIERLRYSHNADELHEIVRITLGRT